MREIRVANDSGRLWVSILQVALAVRLPWGLLAPVTSAVWHLPSLRSVVRREGVQAESYHACAFAAGSRTPMRFASYCLPLLMLSRYCRKYQDKCQYTGRSHWFSGTTPRNKPRTREFESHVVNGFEHAFGLSSQQPLLRVGRDVVPARLRRGSVGYFPPARPGFGGGLWNLLARRAQSGAAPEAASLNKRCRQARPGLGTGTIGLAAVCAKRPARASRVGREVPQSGDRQLSGLWSCSIRWMMYTCTYVCVCVYI